jgi:hydroxylamine reductase (hybrid-cluster protein)
MAPKFGTVTIQKSTHDYAIAEFNRIHALADLAGVPRVHDSGQFTASQRVEIMASVLEQHRLNVKEQNQCYAVPRS